MCKETKLGLAAGLLMIIIMAIGFRTNDPKKEEGIQDLNSEKIVRKNQKETKDQQFQTTSRSPKNGPTLE
ncbi:MAG: hypothetical protein EBT92_01040 [Planctomycetes bacterium]|nr:hypothetical protein [Planctomycetota bacterium]NBY00727.1 hypothetical protein [Planctomycetota bacterium]